MNINNEKFSGTDVLIIDDEPDICQLLTLILKQKNVNSRYTNSLSEAKETLKQLKPKMIFLDNHLSDGLGIDFIDQIRKLSPDSKIVMITAHNSEENRLLAYQKGAVRFIGKPFNSDEISDTISKFL